MLNQCCKWEGLTNQTEKFDQNERLWSLHKSPHADVSYGVQDGTNHLWMDSNNGPPATRDCHGDDRQLPNSVSKVCPMSGIFFLGSIFIADAHSCMCSGSARFLEFQNLSAKVSPGLSSVVISYVLWIGHILTLWKGTVFQPPFASLPACPTGQLFPNSVLGDCYLSIYI